MNTKKSSGKRALSLLLTLLMVLSVMPMSVFSTFAAKVETASVSASPTPYDGVAVTPQKVTDQNYAKLGFTSGNYKSYKGWYAIRDAKELYGYANLVTGSTSRNKESAVLMNDIVVNSGTVTATGSSSGTTHHWPVIYGAKSSMSTFYGGNFDGNGHYISGLYCNKTGVGRIGFIGDCFGSSHTIKSLTIKNSYFKGSGDTGAIVAKPGSNTKIVNCRVMSDVTVVGYYDVGGIAGNGGYASISYCVSFANATGGQENGAIVGSGGSLSNNHTSTGSHTCENIAVWTNETVATCCYGGVTKHRYCLVCDKVISGEKKVTEPKGHSFTKATCLNPKTCTICGTTEGDISTEHAIANGVCTLCGYASDANKPHVDAKGVYQISKVGELVWFAQFVNSGNKSANAILVADIDLSGHNWKTICETGLYYNGYGDDLGYSGTFDGNGYVIKNVKVKSSTTKDASCGLFGTVSGTVKNLGIEGFTFVDGGKDIRTGAIVGQLITANGKVSNCYVKNATITPGEHVTGGIAGCVYDGTIENCYVVQSNINGTANRYGYIVGDSRADKSETDRLGTVTNCYTDNKTVYSGRIGKITNCATKSVEVFASGEVTYLLNGSKSDGDLVWYQTLKEQSYPQFKGAVVYYDETSGYSNHAHNWTYTKEGNRITATCDASGCTSTDGGNVTLNVKNAYFTGAAVGAIVEGKFTNGATYKITYNDSETVPNSVGTHTVKLTVSEKGTEKQSVTAEYKISYLDAPNPAYTISGGYQNGNDYWFKSGVTVMVMAPAGYEISKTLGGGYGNTVTFSQGDIDKTVYLKRVSDGAMTDAITISEGIYFDSNSPTGKIEIKDRGFWQKLLNKITFGLFFKGDMVATVSAMDDESGWKSIQYYVADKDLINEGDASALEAAIGNNWNNYSNEIALNKNAKNVIYVKITDNVGNVTYINSDGIVLYADAEAVTESVSATYQAGENKDITVKLNGNTIESVSNGTTDLNEGTDYTVSTDGTITLKADYLDTLDVGTCIFTVSYNPLGETYVEATGNDAPATTIFKVSVEAADIVGATVTVNGSFTYDGNAKTPDPVVVLNGEPLVKDQDYDVSYDNNTNAGQATVTVTGKGNYTGTAAQTFTISRAELTNVSVQQNGELTYNKVAQTASVKTNATSVNEQTVTFTYSTEQNGTYGDMPSFINAGTHTVYYKASAPNHEDTTGNFDVTIGKQTVNEPTIESETYTGYLQKADIADTDLYTVTKNEGGTAKGNYDVVLKLKDTANYKWSTTVDAEVTLAFVITTTENSWTTVPSISGWTYGETANAPTYEAKFGTVKVLYSGKANDGSDYSSETAPTKAGNYTATFIVDATEDYSNLEKKVNFSIEKANYDMTEAKWNYTQSFKYDGLEKTVEVKGLPTGVTVSGYTDNKATVVGDYTAKVTLSYDSNNYNTPVVDDLAWSITNDWIPTEYAVSTPNANGWLNNDFVITAQEGYELSLTNTAEGVWSDTLTGAVEGEDNSITFYVKNVADGTISLAKTVNYKLDKTAPTGKVEFVDRTGWEEFLNTITFGLFYKDEVTVKVDASDVLSDVAKIEYIESAQEMSLEALQNSRATWAEMPANGVGVTVEDAKQFVYYIRITDNADNVTYISTDGAEYDTTAPVISGVENGKTYYTTQKVTVTDKNIESITLNGETANSNITLEGNKDATYTIVATDKAGNTTTVTVTMKPISDLSTPIDALNKDNVNSGNEQDIDNVKAAVEAVDTTNATDAEKDALKDITEKATELEKVIDDTKEEIIRITEELKKYDENTVNSDDTVGLDQLNEDIKALVEGGNLTDAERTALTETATDVAQMQKTIEDTATENKRLDDAVDGYDLTTVTSDNKADLEQLLDDIEKQLESKNLTEEEISELNGNNTAVEDLLAKIEETEELIGKLTGDVDSYKDETVKSTDKESIQQLIKDIDVLLETENLTEDEEKTLEDTKTKAEGLLDTIEDAAKATESENTERVKDVTAENVTPENKTDLENAKSDLEKALEDNNGNYTEEEKKAIEDEIDRIDKALEVIENVESVEELISKLPENIKKSDEDAIKVAEEAYNTLTDYEKSLIDKDVKKVLDDAKSTLAELNKPADTNSPATGDNSTLWLWFIFLFVSGVGIFGITFNNRKRKATTKR